MKRYISIRTKFASATGLAAIVIWSILAGLSYRATESFLRLSSQYMFAAASNGIRSQLLSSYDAVEQSTAVLANSRIVDAHSIDSWNENIPFLVEMLKFHPKAASVYIGDRQGDFFIVRRLNQNRLWNIFNNPAGTAYGVDYLRGDQSQNPVRLYYSQSLELLESRELPPSDYDPRVRPWYQLAIASSDTITTRPYVFFFAQKLGITVAKADVDKTAVVATDIFLDSISSSLKQQLITPSSEMVLHVNGNVWAWSGDSGAIIETYSGELRQKTLSELEPSVFPQIAEGTQSQEWLVNRTPLEFTNGVTPELIIAVPKKELLADFEQVRRRTLLLSLVVLLLMVPLTWVLADHLSIPIRKLHRAIESASSEEFEEGLNFWLPEIKSNDEIGDLHTAMRNMHCSLRQYVRTLAVETRSRERLESELNIARRIQMDFVPGGGLLHIDIAQNKIYAKLIPAKAVGGDLYEFLPLSESRFFVAVGDVSDKGVPAALFMSRTVALAKMLVPKTNTLSAFLYEINNQLVVGNDSCMFITLFCAIIDTKKGIINYASAGHNPPVLVTKDCAQFLDIEVNSPLGIFEGTEYAESAMQFGLGENLVIYTDGITEAFDHNRNEFSEQRLIKLLSRQFKSVEEIGDEILTAVSKFAEGTPQSDDITILILGHA